MAQAVADLPDPLDGLQPADATSADDLLSKLAGDEIDRLLAESEAGVDAPVPPTTPAPTEMNPPAPAVATPEPPSAAAVELDDVLNTADAARSALRENILASTGSSANIDLRQSDARRNPFWLLLKPLEWLNAPLEPWPDQFRDILGKVGVMTLINAIAVLAYVLLFRRHHH